MRRFHVALVAPFVLAACVTRTTGPGGPGMTIDPNAGAACPAQHVVIAVAPIDSSGASRVLRRAWPGLAPCQGLSLGHADGEVVSVGGLPDGSDLIGVGGTVRRVLGGSVVWASPYSGSRSQVGAGALVPVRAGERDLVAVLWVDTDYGGSAQGLDLLDATSGEKVASYEVSSGMSGLGAGIDGPNDHLVLMSDYDPIRSRLVQLGADSLGSTGELEIQLPQATGRRERLTVVAGNLAAGAEKGILYWRSGLPSAALGPVSCQWPMFAGSSIPERCSSYPVVVPLGGESPTFLAACDRPVRGGDTETASALMLVGYRGDCDPVIDSAALSQQTIVGIAWSGPPP